MVQGVRLRIRGVVQGVFYRKSTEARAKSLGLSGWVRNLTDGSVEAFAVGARDDLEKLVDWCRRGPSGARVDSLEIIWREDQSSIIDEDEQIEPDSGFCVRGSFW